MTQLLIAALLAISLSACSSTSSRSGEHKLSKKERVQVLMEVAAANLNENNPNGALPQLLEAQELDSSLPEIHYMLALCYFHKDELTLAEEAAKKAIELKPDFSGAKNTLGKIYLDQANYIAAEKYLLEAAKDYRFREAHLAKTNLGILYFKTTKHTEAEKWLTKAIKDTEGGACMASYYRGQIYFSNGELEKASQDFNRASKLMCAQFTDAHMATAKTYLRLKKYDQARAKFIEIQQLFPTTDAANQATDFLREIP